MKRALPEGVPVPGAFRKNGEADAKPEEAVTEAADETPVEAATEAPAETAAPEAEAAPEAPADEAAAGEETTGENGDKA